MKRTTSTAFVLSALALPGLAEAQLRVVTYNTGAAARPGLSTILQQIGNEQANGFAKPIDVLLLQEVEFSSDLTSVVNTLNSLYGSGSYAAAPLIGQTSGGGRPAMVYRTDSVSLLGTTAVGSVNVNANARQTLRYQVRPVGYDANADFFIYNSHYKAGNSMDGTDQARRNVEATSNRVNADALGANRHIMFAGDLNLYTGNEPAFQTLVSSGNAQASDPINTPLNWRGVSSLRYAHTQSPATSQFYDGQVTGGMDDRFDFQLLTAAMRDNEGLSIINGSYRAFGNNGTHPLNGAINSGSNTWNPAGLTTPAQTVKTALIQTSDHLPVVADYQVPAVMSVDVVPLLGPVIVGASAVLEVNITNTANVVASIGADRLNFNVTSAGDLTGSGSGTVSALAAPASRTVFFDTSAPGIRSGTVSVSTTSQAAANPSFSQQVSATVLAASNASFDPNIDADVLQIDFGIRARDLGPVLADFDIFNLADSSGFTAGLDLDSIGGFGDVATLTTNLGTFTNLVAGASASFVATLDTAAVGTFSANYLIQTSDENLPGATAGAPIVLSLGARVALGGDANLDDIVNLADFNILAQNFGSTSADWLAADFNNDGLVNLTDFNILAQNFGLSAAGPDVTPEDWSVLAAAVPEPALSVLPAVAASAAMLRRRRRPARVF